MSENKKIRTRIAPSPTGWLHVGTLRVVLYNWCFSKQKDGDFILRIEDTDKERSKQKYTDDIKKWLEFFDFNWDEIYKQSKREDIYQKYLDKALDNGDAFYCFHKQEELVENKPHFCSHKDLSEEEVQDKKEELGSYVIRFNNDRKEDIVFDDIIRGRVEFDPEELGDFSLAKEDQFLYNFAVVIDDFDMDITHVIRGEDHISNTPKQILLYNALGLEAPTYAHLPLLLDENKSKLSKRSGAVAIKDYIESGYLPDAIFNFLALLGWHPKDNNEIVSKERFINEFELEDVKKGASVFDKDKLNWLNSHYLRNPEDRFFDESTKFLKEKIKFILKDKGFDVDPDDFEDIFSLIGPRIDDISELEDLLEGEFMFFWEEELDYSPELLVWKDYDLEKIRDVLKDTKDYIEEEWFSSEGLMEFSKKRGDGDRGLVLWPLRAALTGRETSPSPDDIIPILGKEETIDRINYAINLCEEELG